MRTLIVVATMMMPASAQAFEWAGYRSGMSRHEVEAKSRQEGYTLRDIGTETLMQQRQSTNGLWEVGFTIGFCGEKLYFLGRSLSGAFDAFAHTATDYRQKSGPGSFLTRSEYGPNGLTSEVKATFVSPDGNRFEVSFISAPPGVPTTLVNVKNLSFGCK